MHIREVAKTDEVTDNTRCRCQEENILFYRLNPSFKEYIDSGETDTKKLLKVILETREQTKVQIRKVAADFQDTPNI